MLPHSCIGQIVDNLAQIAPMPQLHAVASAMINSTLNIPGGAQRRVHFISNGKNVSWHESNVDTNVPCTSCVGQPCRSCGQHCTLAQLAKCGGTSLANIVHDYLHMATAAGIFIKGVGIREWGGLVASDIARGDVIIAQIRDPWAYYGSLWNYLSSERDMHGTFHGYQPKLDRPNSSGTEFYSKEIPRGNSSADRKRFAAFVRAVGSPDLGVLSMHVWANYALALGGNERIYVMPLGKTVPMEVERLRRANSALTAADIKSSIKNSLLATLTQESRKRFCWVHTESMADDAKRCLQACGAANMLAAPKMQGQNSHADALTDIVKTYHRNPSRPMVPLGTLYAEDKSLVAYIRRADAAIFRVFPEYPLVPPAPM